MQYPSFMLWWCPGVSIPTLKLTGQLCSHTDLPTSKGNPSYLSKRQSHKWVINIFVLQVKSILHSSANAYYVFCLFCREGNTNLEFSLSLLCTLSPPQLSAEMPVHSGAYLVSMMAQNNSAPEAKNPNRVPYSGENFIINSATDNWLLLMGTSLGAFMKSLINQ